MNCRRAGGGRSGLLPLASVAVAHYNDFDADPDPTLHFDADLDHHIKVIHLVSIISPRRSANLQSLAYRAPL